MAIKVKDDAAKTSHHLNHFVMEKLFYQVYDDVFKSTRNKGIFLFWTWTSAYQYSLVVKLSNS